MLKPGQMKKFKPLVPTAEKTKKFKTPLMGGGSSSSLSWTNVAASVASGDPENCTPDTPASSKAPPSSGASSMASSGKSRGLKSRLPDVSPDRSRTSISSSSSSSNSAFSSSNNSSRKSSSGSAGGGGGDDCGDGLACSTEPEDRVPELTEEQRARKEANAKALMTGKVKVARQPFIMNGMLNMAVRKKFKPPGDPSSYSKSLGKKLGGGSFRSTGFMRSKFGSGGSFKMSKVPPKLRLSTSIGEVGEISSSGESDSDSDDEAEKPEFLPHEDLIVWEPTEEQPEEEGFKEIKVPTVLAQFLRPHQREGVKFCMECVLSMRDFDGSGCILADDMGLGKTLQSITTLYTMLMNGKRGQRGEEGVVPLVRRAIVVCPCSLVNNWAQEFEKWINGRVKTEVEKVKALAVSATDKKSVLFAISQFLHVSKPYDVLIISYETFRAYVKKFTKKNDICCDMLICDEAHRLKNPDALTTKALASLACRRRVLLSGTPVQNDLDEFFAMADFTNPMVLGTSEDFRRKYKNPILVGREPGASQAEQDKAKVLQNEMSLIVNQFILRRTNTINAKFLPDKLVQIVCCNLTDVQKQIYKRLMSTKDVVAATEGKVKDALSYIQMMQKLCNHPKILELSCGGKAKGLSKEELALFGVPIDTPGADEKEHNKIYPELSGKMEVLHNLMDVMWKDQDAKRPPDKIVVISVYTQTLDLVQRMCKGKKWPVVRLDGSLAVKKRMELVNAFNDVKNRNSFVFLLSSKAGGCGINLIGANRLVLFDSDWNPATDKQAAARCWRDGQQKNCYTYRFLSAGTLEEKIFQRQLSKEGLAAVVEDKEQVNSLSSGELKQLFGFRENTPSDTHDKLKCTHCKLAIDQAALSPASLAPEAVELCSDLLNALEALPESRHFIAALTAAANADDAAATAVAADAPEAAAAVGTNGDGDHNMADASSSSSSSPPPLAAGGKKGGGSGGKAKANKKDAMTLAYVRRRLQEGAYKKLPEFHKDLRNMVSMAKKNSESAVDKKAMDQFNETFEEQWSCLAPRIAELSSMGAGVKCFTEEELAVKSAQLQAAAATSSNRGSSRRVFNAHVSSQPKKGGPVQLLGQGGKKMGPSLAEATKQAAKKEAAVRVAEAAALARGLSQSSDTGPAFKAQHDLPQEEDLNNWSHHFSTATVEDDYLRRATAGTDLVSFVFGLRVNWDLTQQQQVIDNEKEAAMKEAKAKDLEEAKTRLGSKKKKGGTKRKAAASKPAAEEDADALMNVDGEEKAQENDGSDGDVEEVKEVAMKDSDDDDDDDGDLVTSRSKSCGSSKRAQSSKPKGSSSKASTEEAAEDKDDDDDEEADKPSSPAPKPAAQGENICAFCTFENKPKRKTCEMCKQKLFPTATAEKPGAAKKKAATRKRGSSPIPAGDSLANLNTATTATSTKKKQKKAAAETTPKVSDKDAVVDLCDEDEDEDEDEEIEQIPMDEDGPGAPPIDSDDSDFE